MFKSRNRKKVEALALRNDKVLRLQLMTQPSQRSFSVSDVEEVSLPAPVHTWNSEAQLKETGHFIRDCFPHLSNRAVVGIPLGLTNFTTEKNDQEKPQEEEDLRTTEVTYAPGLKASVRGRCAEKQIELLFRPLVESCGLSILEPVEIAVCRALSFSGPDDDRPQFHMMSWSTSVLFALLVRGEPIFLRSLHGSVVQNQKGLENELKRTTDYVTQLFPELQQWPCYVGGARAKETLMFLSALEGFKRQFRLLKVEDCWDADLSNFAADHWLDALGLALRP